MALAHTSVFRSSKVRLASAAALGTLLVVGPLATSAVADASVPPIATTSAFSVLAGSTVTNVGTTTVSRSVGVSPGTAVTGASTMTVGGTYHQADAVALQAEDDLTTAYNQAANQTPASTQTETDPGAELGGQTLTGGVYTRTAEMALTGALTLDGGNGNNAHSNSVWVFQAGSTLTTAAASSIVLERGADPCNVFWQVGSSATFGTTTTFVGTVMADQSITMGTGATLQGRVLARIAAVNLHANVITSPTCSYDTTVTAGTTTPTVPAATPTPTPTPGTTGNGNGGGGQIKKKPKGGVNTGVVSSGSGHSTPPAVLGWMGVLGFTGLALVAVRRRRRV